MVSSALPDVVAPHQSAPIDLTCDERPSDSPLIARVWRGQAGAPGAFCSMAESHSGLVVTRFRGRLRVTLRGPETRATPAYSPEDAEFFGIHFKPGVFIRKHPPHRLADRRDADLPETGTRRFWLGGASWEFPTFDNVDTLVDWLVRDGLLVHEPLVDAVLHGHPVDASLRTVQRRFQHATGLTHGAVVQIRRARHALALLRQGLPILDVVDAAGYYDQPHLTRAMRRFVGQTPAQLLDPNRTQRLSFLYKTHP